MEYVCQSQNKLIKSVDRTGLAVTIAGRRTIRYGIQYCYIYSSFKVDPGLWIRIRMDPRSFSLLDPDPHSVIQYANPESGGKNLREKKEKMQGKWKKIVILLLNIN